MLFRSRNVKDVRAFLGFANFYRRFISSFSTIALPLTTLTRKDAIWSWTSTQQIAFDQLKTSFTTAPVLRIPDRYKQFRLTTDASLLAVGAVLEQQDENNDWRPCAYFSHGLNSAERNYPIYDRELLAVILALKEWKAYLLNSEHDIVLHTDHQNLTWFKAPQQITRRQA